MTTMLESIKRLQELVDPQAQEPFLATELAAVEIINLRAENDHLWKAHTLLMQLHDVLEGTAIQSSELAGILDNVDQYLRDEALEGGE